MTKNDKLELLSELLSGNVEALRIYQKRRTVNDSDIQIVIDNRTVGGPIEVVEKTGIRREMSPVEFDTSYPFIQNCCITIIDTTGSYRIPDPDEDYSEIES